MGLVIDTSAYSALKRNNPIVRQCIEQADHIYIPVIVIGELQFGFAKGGRTPENTAQLARFIADAKTLVVPVEQAVARLYAHIKLSQQKIGKPLGVNDLWIAATALRLEQPLLTLDSDFERVPELEVMSVF